MLDTKAIALALAPIVKQHVEAATAPLLRRIDELEARASVPGKDGADGRDGVDGKDGAPASEEQIATAVERYLSASPPQAGADGQNGRDGADGERGLDGKDGRDGADGIGLAGAMIDRDGELNVTLTNGEVRKLGPVIGRDGANGRDGPSGTDGQSWDAMDVRRSGPRTIELSFDGGEQRNTFELEFPVPLYRGVFSDGAAYEHGDMVTWAGSLWHCNDATSDKPGEGAKAWTLAAKRGRDGKDFAGSQAKLGPVKI